MTEGEMARRAISANFSAISHRVSMINRNRPNAIPVCLLFAITFCLFITYFLNPDKIIWPASGLGADIAISWPDMTGYYEGIGARSLTIWDDTVAFGRPIPGQLVATWLYPLKLIFFIVPATLGLSILAALHLLLIGVSTYFLIRSLTRVSITSALLGAVTMMLMPKLIAHIAGTHLSFLFGYAWTPVLLLCIWKSYNSRRLLYALYAGLALALQFSGHPQVPVGTFYLVVGISAWKYIKTVKRYGWRNVVTWELLRTIVVSNLVMALSACLIGAVWWLPTLELLPWTAKIEFNAIKPFWYQLPIYMLVSLFAQTEFQFPEWTIYVGIVPLVLSVLSLTGKRRSDAIFLWFGVICALLFALGDQTPFYQISQKLIPGLGYFRTRTRLWLFAGMLIAILTSLGAEALLSSHKSLLASRRRWLNLAFFGYLASGVAVALGIRFLSGVFPNGLIRSVLSVSVFFATLLVWLRYSLPRYSVNILLFLVIIIDLFPTAAGFLTTINPQMTFLKPSSSSTFLVSQPGIFRVYSPTQKLKYPLSMKLGIERIDAFLNMQLGSAVELVKLATRCDAIGFTGGFPPCLTGESNDGQLTNQLPDLALLGLLNVRYLISEQPIQSEDAIPVYYDDDLQVQIYENRRFMPRAFLAEEIIPVKSADQAFELLPALDLSRQAVLEDGEDLPHLSGGAITGNVLIAERSPGHIRLAVESNHTALLIYSQAWAPGWKAMVNGSSTKVLRADGALLGLIIPEGRSLIDLDYSPWGFRSGLIISIISFTLILVLTIIFMVKRLVQEKLEKT